MKSLVIVVLAALLLACDADDGPTDAAGSTDARAAADAAVHPDALVTDTGTADGGVAFDAGLADGGPADSGEADAGAMDAQVVQPPMGYVLVAAGQFEMGSPLAEPDRNMDEGPVRTVTITRDFYLKATEVTQGEWMSVMGNNPAGNAACGADCPVENVNRADAIGYMNTMSTTEGLRECYRGAGDNWVFLGLDCPGYRLPTEAEWEFAARAGTTDAFWKGPVVSTDCSITDPNLDAIGWFSCNSGNQTRPVGQKEANPWGLLDMNGNVLELVNDGYGAYPATPQTDPLGPGMAMRIIARGGAYWQQAPECRNAFRLQRRLTDRLDFLGFRPARTAF